MKQDLKNVPTVALILALLPRIAELFESGNRLIPWAFTLYKAMGAVACIDGIPWRLNDEGKVELMALRRHTGPYPGKLVLVGGTVAMGESLQDALRRHFRDDFCAEIEMPEEPFCMSQYRKNEPDENWMQDPGKEHVISPVYLVQFKSEVPSQSLNGDPVEWISKNSVVDEDFGYTNYRLYRKAFHCFK